MVPHSADRLKRNKSLGGEQAGSFREEEELESAVRRASRPRAWPPGLAKLMA